MFHFIAHCASTALTARDAVAVVSGDKKRPRTGAIAQFHIDDDRLASAYLPFTFHAERAGEKTTPALIICHCPCGRFSAETISGTTHSQRLGGVSQSAHGDADVTRR